MGSSAESLSAINVRALSVINALLPTENTLRKRNVTQSFVSPKQKIVSRWDDPLLCGGRVSEVGTVGQVGRERDRTHCLVQG